MIGTQERTIDGRSYTVTQLPARRSLKLLRKLVAALGPGLATAFGSTQGKDLRGLDVSALGPALERLTAHLDDATLDAVVNEALATVRVDGIELLPQFDIVFQGKLGSLFKVLGFAMEVQYGDFFGALFGELRSRTGASPSSASITSTGPSGGSSPNG